MIRLWTLTFDIQIRNKAKKHMKHIFAVIGVCFNNRKTTFQMYFDTRTWKCTASTFYTFLPSKKCHRNISPNLLSLNWKQIEMATYESDNYGCFSGDIFFCNFPSVFGCIQTDDAQVFQNQTVRFESNVGDVGVNWYIDFGPLVATCAGR